MSAPGRPKREPRARFPREGSPSNARAPQAHLIEVIACLESNASLHRE
jgi:hypothetical protein